MPVTRSASRQNSGLTSATTLGLKKRPSEDEQDDEQEPVVKRQAKKPRKGKQAGAKLTPSAGDVNLSLSNISVPASIPASEAPELLPAVLSFSFKEAKEHLITVDPRFEDLFTKLKCRPFEHLDRIDPFRTLATSILGQQISWLAARAITHKFIRLFDPSLPEKYESGSSSNSNTSFPSARQVSLMDIPTLRTAGLSQRKAEYVQDLAARFADGRLSNEKILQADDEQLYEMLTAVRGIGKWTVDMFAIFSLRRPDILPVGDLGVQRGLARWFLSLHSPKHPISISPKKLPKPQAEDDSGKKGGGGNDLAESQEEVIDGLARIETDDAAALLPPRATTPDASAFPPAPLPVTPVKRKSGGGELDSPGTSSEIPMPPPAFTPSINRTLNKIMPTRYTAPPLPEGLTVKELQNRVEQKKKVKGAILTPKEVEDLTEEWRPYRSLGVFYMWALAEGDKS